MKEQFKLSIKQTWLLISFFSLMLPIFMPSSINPQHFFENVIGTVTVTMFILSFPCSLFGLPILLFAQGIMDVNPNSIQVIYLNLFLFFILGLVQWFWIVPRVLRNESSFQALNLLSGKLSAKLSEAKVNNEVESWDFNGQTPLERIIKEKDSK